MVQVGDKFPTDVALTYIPWTPENSGVLACAIPIPYDLSKKLPGRTVVIVSAPGAFTPTCTANHIPVFIEKIDEFKKKGVDDVVVITADTAFANAAWGKALGAKDEIIFANDPLAALSKELGYLKTGAPASFGVRGARYAVIVKDGVVAYFGVETSSGVTVSGADAVLEAL
ncbi:BA75_00895T0 [Komagataella pastoris]|uniref:BA75_00895T0 n=1 Tax=Komagataella pastoris TaxID=4922 RepID=A0A1B2J821_PICPA|nr:BA75_00895T0 [Komagataella pastoris]